MIIHSLKLRDFRNYQSLEIMPHPGVNILFGQNGSGKTNLLEAIHYCALGRSHREAPETDGEILFTCGGKLPEIGSFANVRLTQADTYDLMGEML